jgi:hypothetical protein
VVTPGRGRQMTSVFMPQSYIGGGGLHPVTSNLET